MSNPFTYTFFIDREVLSMTHADFLKNADLCAVIRNTENFRLFLGLTIMSFSPAYLKARKDVAKEVQALAMVQARNPLQFYAPNSQEQLDFINCEDGATIIANVDPNRVGKTTAAWIRVLTQGPAMIPCDKEWPIFKDHGVHYHEFRGPISCGICTYNTAKLSDPLWKEVVKKWTPDSELGIYGRTYRGKNAKYEPSWGHDKITKFVCDSLLGYYTYESDQGNFEGGALMKWLWDEQGKEHQWDGADRGTRTTGGQHIFSLTPHKVEGRPDTGASGFLYPILTGKRTSGHKVRTFTGTDVDDVPDWIYPQASKDIEIAKWETEPTLNNDRKRIAEGRARLHGEWHRTAGLVLDEWTPELSVIEPLWIHPPLNEFSVYRCIDHGYKHPFCCLWLAVDRFGNILVFRELYTTGRTVHPNVAEMVRLSGNRLKFLDTHDDDKSGMTVKRYEEVYECEPVVRQVLDSRSFTLVNDSVGRSRGWLYRAAGLRGIAKAEGKFYDHWVPLANELLKPDYDRKHLITGELGAPRVYVFSSCVNFIREIEAWAWKEGRGEQLLSKELPTEGNNDAMTAFGYGIQMRLRYVPNMMQVNSRHEERDGEEGVVKRRPRAVAGTVGGYRSV